MNIKFLFCSLLLAACAGAQADWFLRGTQNHWATTPMAAGGTNTMEVKNVVFHSAGSVKFDRFGDWSQNYGVGGRNGGNIPVAAGIWDIKFFTDTKSWAISRAAQYHLRGTHNKWAEGDLLTAVAGSSANYEICRNFSEGDAGGGPRFKVDINGGWGSDAFPAQDYSVSGWTKIVLNGSERKFVSVTTQLDKDCLRPITFTHPGPVTLHVGDSLSNPTNTPWMAYMSNKPAVVNVAIFNGNVTALAAGTATVTATEESCIGCPPPRSVSYVINVLP